MCQFVVEAKNSSLEIDKIEILNHFMQQYDSVVFFCYKIHYGLLNVERTIFEYNSDL